MNRRNFISKSLAALAAIPLVSKWMKRVSLLPLGQPTGVKGYGGPVRIQSDGKRCRQFIVYRQETLPDWVRKELDHALYFPGWPRGGLFELSHFEHNFFGYLLHFRQLRTLDGVDAFKDELIYANGQHFNRGGLPWDFVGRSLTGMNIDLAQEGLGTLAGGVAQCFHDSPVPGFYESLI